MAWLDLTKVESGDTEFEPLPAGEYLMCVKEALVKDTKAGDGQFINIQFKVLGPKEYENRIIFHRFTIQNKSEKAVKFGLTNLKHFMHAAGVKEDDMSLESPSSLEGLCCMVNLALENTEAYGKRNVVTPYGFSSQDADIKVASNEVRSKAKQNSIPDFMR